jgi:Peptidase A4 family
MMQMVTNYPIDLRVGTPDASLKKPERIEASPVGKLLPPLEGDPMALSNKDLIARGYPPRPDPVAAPSRYALWLKIVSRPFTIVNPRSVPHPGVYHAPTTVEFPRLNSPAFALPPPAMQHSFNNAPKNTWSGAYITQPAGQYYLIEAVWHVPSVDYSLPDSPYAAAAAEWVGLDNAINDLVQAGSRSDSVNLGFWAFPIYYMWLESLPAPESSIPSLPISPGDEVFVWVFIADSSGETLFSDGNLTSADDKVWFYIADFTNNTSYSNALPRPSTFTGSTAEFIMERPCYGSGPSNCTPYALAAFGFSIMSHGWYADSAFADNINTLAWPLPCNGIPPKEGRAIYFTMQNPADGDLLAYPFSVFPSSLSEPCSILWVWLNYQ